MRVPSAEEYVKEAFKRFVMIRAGYAYTDMDHFRCIGDSPSGQLFAEMTMSGLRWKHVEVQIISYGTGDVAQLWERERSV